MSDALIIDFDTDPNLMGNAHTATHYLSRHATIDLTRSAPSVHYAHSLIAGCLRVCFTRALYQKTYYYAFCGVGSLGFYMLRFWILGLLDICWVAFLSLVLL